LTINKNGERPKKRFVSLTSAASHNSKTQVKETVESFNDIASVYTKTRPVGSSSHLSGNDILRKTVGINSDHAEDQKSATRIFVDLRHVAWMIHLGEEEVGHMGTEDRAKWERGIKLAAIDASGSSSTWQLLSDADQDRHFQLERDRQLRELGNSAFTALPPKAQRGITLFVWVGCCMHKDLNCVKGGAVALAKFWDAHNLPGPHRFFNKDNDATVSLAGNPAAPTAAEQRAVRVSERGGIKLCALTGSLLNNKDDKKGYHDTHVWCFKLWFGVSKRFADTSNTRFGSYVDASTEIYVRKDGFIRLLEHVRDKKGSGTLIT